LAALPTPSPGVCRSWTASGYIILGPAYDLPKLWSYNNYQYTASMTWIHGKHSIKVRRRVPAHPVFLETVRRHAAAASPSSAATPMSRMADLLLGFPSSTSRQLDGAGALSLGFETTPDTRRTTTSCLPRLTLNLGLRYELMKTAAREVSAPGSMFIPDLGKQIVSGNGRSLPSRVRFAYQRHGSTKVLRPCSRRRPAAYHSQDGRQQLRSTLRFSPGARSAGTRTVIRGGYGIFYGSSSLYRMDEYSDVFPFSINESYSAVANTPTAVTVSNPYPLARPQRGAASPALTAGRRNRRRNICNRTILPSSANSAAARCSRSATPGPRARTSSGATTSTSRGGNWLYARSGRTPASALSTSFPTVPTRSTTRGRFTVRRRFSKQLNIRAALHLRQVDRRDFEYRRHHPVQLLRRAQDSRNLKG